jgi:hypothetical protein
MGDNEYEDSIEKFRQHNTPPQMMQQAHGMQQGPGGPGMQQGPQGPGMQQGPGGPGGPGMQQGPGGPQGPTPEQIEMMQRQKMMQQQQAMQQQLMQQQMMKQQQQQSLSQSQPRSKNMSLLDKLKRLKNNDTLQELFLIAVLFIIFSTGFFKQNLSRIPFVSYENNCLNTAGLLISALLIALIFTIVKILLL